MENKAYLHTDQTQTFANTDNDPKSDIQYMHTNSCHPYHESLKTNFEMSRFLWTKIKTKISSQNIEKKQKTWSTQLQKGFREKCQRGQKES